MSYIPISEEIFIHGGNRVKNGGKTIKELHQYVTEHPDVTPEYLIENYIKKITILTAVSEWLATLKSEETRRKYGRAIQYLYEKKEGKNIISADYPIAVLDSWMRYRGGNEIQLIDEPSKKTIEIPIGSIGISNLLKMIIESESSRKIAIAAYSKFCDFIRTKTWGLVEPEPGTKEQAFLVEAEEISENVNVFDFINKIPKPSNLIAELVFTTAFQTTYRLKICDSSNNILSLEKSQIDFKENSITFESSQSYHAFGLKCHYPNKFMKKIQEHIKNSESKEIFLNSKNSPIHHKQVIRDFSKASKLIGVKMTPQILPWLGVIEKRRKQRNNLL